MRLLLPSLCAVLLLGCTGDMVTLDSAPTADRTAPRDSSQPGDGQPGDGQPGDGGSCERGTYFQGYCYFTAGLGSMDYSAAKAVCTAGEAEPASIHSQELNSLIFQMVLKIRDGIWIGLVSSGTAHVWEDGSALDYTNWASGEPDDESCVIMVGPWADQSRQSKWADSRCSRSYEEIICQKAP